MAAALIPVDDWQQHLKNWPDRIVHIKENVKFTDFRFIVGPEKTVFHAHKLIFAASSPEFENLFYLLQTDMEEIELPDISVEVFEDFFNFIYTGAINITSENVNEMIKLATLYSIKILTGKCENFLKENVVKENVLKFMDLATANNFVDSTSECLKIIQESSKEICESPEFNEISKQSLEKIVEFEMLSCDELILFKAVEKWSEFECERNQKEINAGNKRAAVGATFTKIRFGAMSFEELINCSNVNTSLITFTDFFKQESVSKLNLKKRIGQLTIGRFLRFPHGPYENERVSLGGAIRFNISVNKNVYLVGYGVYGRQREALENYGKATFIMSLKNETDTGSIILTTNSETVNCDGTDKIYEIYLKTPVFLEQFKMYSFTDNVDGPNTVFQNFYGTGGKTEIEQNGVTLKITKVIDSKCKLDESTKGRIASFIFRC